MVIEINEPLTIQINTRGNSDYIFENGWGKTHNMKSSKYSLVLK
jgi:hypothetical protein